MEKKLICSECGEEIPEDEEYWTLEDSTVLCDSCYSDIYRDCCMCGGTFRKDDMEWWGDERICRACLEAESPTLDEEKNEEETGEAYKAMLKRYLGRKASACRGRSLNMTYDDFDDAIRYSIWVTFDDSGVITDVGRLTAERTTSEWLGGSDSRGRAVGAEDYEWLVDSMFDDYVKFDDQE